MKAIEGVYVNRRRGPWVTPHGSWLDRQMGERERAVLAQPDCEAFMHATCRDCDFYANNTSLTYYSPTTGQFTVDTATRTITG